MAEVTKTLEFRDVWGRQRVYLFNVEENWADGDTITVACQEIRHIQLTSNEDVAAGNRLAATFEANVITLHGDAVAANNPALFVQVVGN